MDALKPDRRRSRVRWGICALLFAATTLNYLDRTVFGILGGTLQDDLHWSEFDFSSVVMAFSAAYAIGLLLAGKVIDLIGLRLGYALAVTVWSLAAVGNALAGSAGGFIAARFMLGLGESGNFPAAIKAVAQWFPASERALATGIFNSGANIGAIAGPLLVPWIATTWGWRWAFVATGAIGLLWPLCWWRWYRAPADHPRIAAAELAHIGPEAASSGPRPTWDELLRLKATWAFVLAKSLTDPVWWFYLYWFPKFLKSQHVSLEGLALPLAVVYIVSDVGSIAGGWCSSRLVARGWSVMSARLAAMALSVALILPVAIAPAVGNLAWTVGLVALAAAGHQGWSANLFTLVSDRFPQRMVGTVVGLGGVAGAIGGMAMAAIVARILTATGGNYLPLFIIGAGVYMVALALVYRLMPRSSEPAVLAA
jgi:ACS family hexuronate transporter-like MFS transporter